MLRHEEAANNTILCRDGKRRPDGYWQSRGEQRRLLDEVTLNDRDPVTSRPVGVYGTTPSGQSGSPVEGGVKAQQQIPRWWDRYNAIVSSNLTSRQKLAMLVIAGFAGDTNQCTAAMDTIASAISLSRSAATKLVRELHDAGLVERVRRQHSSSVLAIVWSRFKSDPQWERFPIGDFSDRKFQQSQSETRPIDTTSLNTKLNTHRTAAEAMHQQITSTWNESASKLGLPAAKSITDKRRATIDRRLADPEFATNWQAALERLPKATFALGAGNRGWRMTLDDFLHPDKFTRLMEGGYDHVSNGKPRDANSAARIHTTGDGDGPEIIDV